ncbi:hypothetical protein [Hymenobacter lucidus]|uniref:DUF4153 domain-containing protein n=1 Tax=Hymenobacter lucidus TaxID=2880930 RepID=A0ABS8ANF5_9BACT|nr:hypothetical protein [Hymenobacter lucidus]MCB2407707.1 hypothetical protein [Hymenobacter lucidus]
MKDEILAHLNDPRQLERLYQADKRTFKRAFNALYPELGNQVLAGYWKERLSFAGQDISWGSGKDLLFVLLASLLAGGIAKLPMLLALDENVFYPRNIGFILFPMLTAFFAWKNNLDKGKTALVVGAILLGAVYINSLPLAENSDTLILACLHLLLFLWSILGFAFVGEARNNVDKRLDFLRYNGDLVVMTALILLAGGIMTGLTIGLFSLIGFRIEKFYVDYVVTFGLPAAPIAATFLTQTNPQLVGRVSPVIAKIFSPLVLVMLIIYLAAMVYSGKDPYNDREFLLLFNGLLIGVMAIIFFSIAETSQATKSRAELWVLLLLSAVTIVVNSIALSAIVFRIAEWGITSNRAAVLGGNVLMLLHLLLVTAQLFRVLFRQADTAYVGKAIATFLPVYCFWTSIVTFLFPLLFSFK